MLIPSIDTPFLLKWGFSTKNDKEIDISPIIKPTQVHGVCVLKASYSTQTADGLWTQTPNMAIGITVADCVPILLAGLVNKEPWIAAIHAGWRGAVNGILRNCISTFVKIGGNTKDITWAFGPSIQKCHFETNKEVVQLARKDPAWQEHLAEPSENDKFYLDLHGFLRCQAIDLNLDINKDGSIVLCTYCLPNLLNSYRRNPLCQRQFAWIKIDY